MRTITLDEFYAELKGQGVPNHEHSAFICPMCETIQSGHDLVKAGAGDDFNAVEKYVGYSCIGRFTGKKLESDSKLKKQGCNWTLGGLFKTHKLEITLDGRSYPRFELATPEDAQAHYASQSIKAPKPNPQD